MVGDGFVQIECPCITPSSVPMIHRGRLRKYQHLYSKKGQFYMGGRDDIGNIFSITNRLLVSIRADDDFTLIAVNGRGLTRLKLVEGLPA